MRAAGWLHAALTCPLCGCAMVSVRRQYVTCFWTGHAGLIPMETFLDRVEAARVAADSPKGRQCIRNLARRVIDAGADSRASPSTPADDGGLFASPASGGPSATA